MSQSKKKSSARRQGALNGQVILAIVGLITLIGIIIFFLSRDDLNDSEVSSAESAINSTLTPVSSISPISPISSISPISPNSSVTEEDEASDVLYEKGKEAFSSGNCAEAVLAYTRALEFNYPNPGVAYNSRGTAYVCLEDYKSALADYDEAIALLDNFPHAYYNRGLLHDLIGNNQEALADFQKAVDLDPAFGYRAHGSRGIVYYEMAEFDQAIEEFTKAIGYDQSKARVFFLRAETHMALDNVESAIVDYEIAISKSPDYPDALQSLGDAYNKVGRYSDAIETLIKAVELVPLAPSIHFDLGLVYLASGDEENSLTEYRQGVDLLGDVKPDQKEILLNKAKSDLDELIQNDQNKSDIAQEIDQLLSMGEEE